eukprot:5555763-Amphidinium_carterae.1
MPCFEVFLEDQVAKCFVFQCLVDASGSNALFYSVSGRPSFQMLLFFCVWWMPVPPVPCFTVFLEDQVAPNTLNTLEVESRKMRGEERRMRCSSKN